jgi:3'-5' exonuclease
MLEKVLLEKVLFLDIETIPQVSKFSEWDEQSKQLFLKKNNTSFQKISASEEAKNLTKEEICEEVFKATGGIQSEFGKIICISVGFVHEKYSGKEIRLKSFYHDDEETLLKQFISLVQESPKFNILCGHNAKEFDIPYICRRILINGLKLPEILNIAGKKPWEINHLDTLELWKFGDYKAYTSLALLCHVFNIPTPKDDISGADVARVYYENDKDVYSSGLERVKTYCEKDVVALIQLFLRMRGNSLVTEDSIYFSEK